MENSLLEYIVSFLIILLCIVLPGIYAVRNIHVTDGKELSQT
jgi:hypothetical protein